MDNTKPLIVTSCGNYRVKNRSEVVTHRPKGRKDYQLLYIASGKGHFFIHGEEKTVSAGNIIIYLPDQPQEYVYYREDQTDVYWVHFTGNEVEEILKYYNINLQNNILYIGTSPDYQWLFGQMIQELQLCRPRYDELISLQLRNIFVLISRAIMSAKKFSSTSEKEVAFAMHYFRKNYNTEISIEEYSESRGLSNCWFIQCFKEITGYMKKIKSKSVNEFGICPCVRITSSTKSSTYSYSCSCPTYLSQMSLLTPLRLVRVARALVEVLISNILLFIRHHLYNIYPTHYHSTPAHPTQNSCIAAELLSPWIYYLKRKSPIKRKTSIFAPAC